MSADGDAPKPGTEAYDFSDSPRRELALFHLPALLALGLLYGLAETTWQRFFARTPEGLPGDTGPGLVATVALGLTVFGVPALLAALVAFRRRGFQGPWLVWIAGLAPTLVLVVDRLATRLKWEWMHTETGGPLHYLWLGAVTLGVAALVGLAGVFLLRLTGWMRKGAWGWVLVPLCALLAVAAPYWLWASLPASSLPTGAAKMAGAEVADPARPNILVLTVDTLRQDALGAYGGPPTPRLDALIGSGVRFDGWSVSPWTRPAMGALFSGLAPTGNGGGPGRALNADTDWWVERLQAEGWVTAGVLCNPQLRRRFGFDRGFDGFEHSDEVERLAPITRSLWGVWLTRQIVDRGQAFRGDNMVRRAQSWLEDEATDLPSPWMLWVHTMDPHLPYHLRGSEGRPTAKDEPAWVEDLGEDFSRQRFFDLPGAREGTAVTTEPARAALRKLYQTEVDFTDHWLGELIDTARAASGDRPLLWVLTSDHGEEFWEAGGFEHGHSLDPTVLRVPLAMGGLPELPAGRMAGGMKISDVGPTLLGLLRLPPMDPARGALLESSEAAFLPLVTGQDRSALLRRGPGGWGCSTPAMIAEGMLYGPSRTRLLLEDGSGVVRNDETGERVREWLCDVPEVTPPYADTPDSARVDRESTDLWTLDLWRERASMLGREVERDPELDRRLRALGYTQ